MARTGLDRLTPPERLHALGLAEAVVDALVVGDSWAFGEALAASSPIAGLSRRARKTLDAAAAVLFHERGA
jgi:hypothetical protein